MSSGISVYYLKGVTGVVVTAKRAWLKHTALIEERRLVKLWYSVIAFGLKVFGPP